MTMSHQALSRLAGRSAVRKHAGIRVMLAVLALTALRIFGLALLHGSDLATLRAWARFITAATSTAAGSIPSTGVGTARPRRLA